MDNNYFTEKIAPKTKQAQENTPQTPKKDIIPADLTEHRQNHSENEKP